MLLSHPHVLFWSQILNCIWICASLFPLSQIPHLIVPFGSCRILRNTRFPPSFSIKHIYVSILKSTFWRVLHSFFFFLIALFAFSFLNFHGLHGCVCRGYICVYTRGLGFLHVWVPWTYDPHKLWEWLARPCFFNVCFCSFEEEVAI